MPDNGASSQQNGDSSEFVVRFEAGTEIFHEGDPGDAMFIIKSGTVEIVREADGGRVPVAVLDEGDFFGEMSILENEPRMASARAVTGCDLLRIDSSTFDQMVRQNPEIPIRMLRKLSRRLRQVAAGPVCVDEVEVERVEPATGGGDEATEARLVHPASGTEFPIRHEHETFIGRQDAATGFHPEVVLEDIDPRRSTSRRHARIIGRDGSFFVLEEIGVVNGTFVNGQPLKAGVEVELRDGDEVRFGLVKTVFRLD
jgi:pSer/pThr/pTyr-binding forkhead associated (FHA) protein